MQTDAVIRLQLYGYLQVLAGGQLINERVQDSDTLLEVIKYLTIKNNPALYQVIFTENGLPQAFIKLLANDSELVNYNLASTKIADLLLPGQKELEIKMLMVPIHEGG